MGVNISLRGADMGDHDTDLCTNLGYVNLCKWFDSLPAGDYPALAALSKDGQYRNTKELSDQLIAAMNEHPPGDPDTLSVADRLGERLGGGYPGETVGITS